MKRALFFPACLSAIVSAGCLDFMTNKTSPTSAEAVQLTSGPWASIASATTLTNTCVDFHWTSTAVTGASGSGTFTAKCMGSVQVAGTARGTLTDTTVTWSADATGTAPGGAACPVTLNGTATFDGTQFRIPYTGTTCLGPVSGTEILRKS